MTTRYLALERKRAAAETTTPDCTFEKCTGCGACQALDCDNVLAGVRSMPSAPAEAAGGAEVDGAPAEAAAGEVDGAPAFVAAGEAVGAPASEVAPVGAEVDGAPAHAVAALVSVEAATASPAAAEVSGNDSSAEAASDECPLPASEGGAR